MRNSETGEFELVVGNRQLLSGFFIVVLLFAVAFSMGYIVGRSSSPSAKLQAETAAAPRETRPQPAPSAPPATPLSQPADAAQQAPADTGPQPSTQPARETQAAGGTPPAPGGTAPGAPAEAPRPAAAAPAEPAPGSYWQVMALKLADAEVLRQTLKDKGFPVSLSPGPNNLTRVLVGPYNDTQSLGRAKTELENAGFRPIRK